MTDGMSRPSARTASSFVQRLDRHETNSTEQRWCNGITNAGTAERMSSMVELVVAVVALVSACIFLAHAIEAYRA
jgi:hypothetical protein